MKIFKNIWKFLIFLKFQKYRDTMDLVVTLSFSHFISSILIFNIRSTMFSVHVSQCDNVKP